MNYIVPEDRAREIVREVIGRRLEDRKRIREQTGVHLVPGKDTVH